jgi:hypothetical protein
MYKQKCITTTQEISMLVEITINGITRRYRHNENTDYNEVVTSMIETVNEVNEDMAKSQLIN